MWSVLMSGLTAVFLSKSGKRRFAFLTEKMEDKWYWWELFLLVRKLLIMACGLLNTSTPYRGWYLASLVIILSLTAHAFARPFKDPWVDATELISLWSTLFIFQVILATAPGVSNEGGSSPLLVPLPAVSWSWVPACGLLEPSRRDGENAQKTGKKRGKNGRDMV